MNTRININSPRELEKEFTHLVKLFEGKETELNWTARNNALIRLREIINEKNDDWRDALLSGIRELAAGIVKTIHSIRTTFATEALSLVSDISINLGDGLDNYTVDLFLNSLLKLNCVTKRIIADKSIAVTTIFLEYIPFHIKTLSILCKSMQDKNMQLRQACTTYFKTVLEIHASKENVRSVIDKSDGTLLIVHFLERGLADASPKVREGCRQLYWIFHQYWPERAEKMMQFMESKTLSSIKRVNSMPSAASPTRSRSPLSSSSHTSSHSSSSLSSSHLPKPTSLRPHLKRSLSSASTPPSAIRRAIPITPTEPPSHKLNRLSHISNVSAPATPHVHKVIGASTPTRRTKSDYHQQSSATSIMHMIQSKDVTTNIKALRTLCERMKHVYYNPSHASILPPDIPPKVSLSMAIMDYLSNHELDPDIYKALTSWECLASVFVNVLAFNYYAPTLIIAQQEHQKEHECKNTTSNDSRRIAIFSTGLIRLKLFLKRKDSELPNRLLDLLKACKDNDNSVLDSSVRRDMLVFPSYRSSLLIGLLKWMDEILCDYLGLAEEEDQEMLMEGSRYLDGEACVGQWFDDNENVAKSLDLVFDLLLLFKDNNNNNYNSSSNNNGNSSDNNQGGVYDWICILLGHLKLANQRVFERVLNTLDDPTIINKALMNRGNSYHHHHHQQQQQQQEEEEEEEEEEPVIIKEEDDDFLDISFGSIELEDIKPEPSINEADNIPTWDNILFDSDIYNYNDDGDSHTGMTQDISKMNFGIDLKNLGSKTIAESKTTISEVPSATVFSKPASSPVVKGQERKSMNRRYSLSPPRPSHNRASTKHTRSPSSQQCNENEYYSTKKKRRLEQCDPETQHASNLIIDLAKEPKRALFLQLETIPSGIWHDQAEVFYSLIDVLINVLTNQTESIRLHATRFLKSLIQDKVLVEKLLSPNLTFRLLKALFDGWKDAYTHIPPVAEETVHSLLYDDKTALKQLWNLANEYLHQKIDYALSTLFNFISKEATKISVNALEESLEQEGGGILVKCFSHKDVAVRKSCVQASVGIYQVLGEPFIKIHLAPLNSDQLHLLNHYISNQTKQL